MYLLMTFHFTNIEFIMPLLCILFPKSSRFLAGHLNPTPTPASETFTPCSFCLDCSFTNSPMIWILTSSKSIFLSLINRLLSLKPEHFLYQLSCFLFHFAGSILFHYLIKSKCDKLTIYYNFVLYQKGKKRNPLEM